MAFRECDRFAALVVLAVGLMSCGEPPWETYVYTIPTATGDGWATGSADSVGLDPAPLEAAVNAVGTGAYAKVDGIVVVRRGTLVLEAYFDDFERDTLHDLRSATKSMTSALVGIAIDQGRLALDDRVLPRLGGEARFRNVDDRKRAITVEHLLTMTPGLACDDWDGSSPGNEGKMYEERDWLKFIFDQPMLADPGTRWAYCSGGVVSLGAVMGQATGERADAFARRVLFGPLGIERAEWDYTPLDVVDTGGHIKMRPRDMAKFGQLFLQRGVWKGQRLLSEAYLDRSTSFRVRTSNGLEYGYLWWRRTVYRDVTPISTYFASGNGGQYIVVAPALEMVAVFTGSGYNTAAGNNGLAIFDQYLVPAVR